MLPISENHLPKAYFLDKIIRHHNRMLAGSETGLKIIDLKNDRIE